MNSLEKHKKDSRVSLTNIVIPTLERAEIIKLGTKVIPFENASSGAIGKFFDGTLKIDMMMGSGSQYFSVAARVLKYANFKTITIRDRDKYGNKKEYHAVLEAIRNGSVCPDYVLHSYVSEFRDGKLRYAFIVNMKELIEYIATGELRTLAELNSHYETGAGGKWYGAARNKEDEMRFRYVYPRHLINYGIGVITYDWEEWEENEF